MRAVVNMWLDARCSCVLCVRSATGNGEKAKQTYILDISQRLYVRIHFCIFLSSPIPPGDSGEDGR